MPSLATVLQEALAESTWGATVEHYRAVIIWEEAVGNKIAKACKAVDIDGDTLIVKAKNASWRNEIAFQKEDIMKRLNKKLNKTIIKDIKFL